MADMTAQDDAAEDTAGETAAGEVAAEVATATVNVDNTEAVVGSGCDNETVMDCELLSSSESALATDELAAAAPLCQTAGDDTQLLASVNDCASVAGDTEHAATAARSTLELLESPADVTDCDWVQLPVDDAVVTNDTAHDAAVHDEPAAAAAAVPNEPQPAVAADAEVVEPVGNIIPPPLAVLAPQGLGDVHQAMMQGGGPVGFQPYKHPNLFALRVIVSCCLQ